MKRLDLARYFLAIQPKLSGVEAELQRLLQSDVAVVEKLAAHIREGQGKRLRPALVLLPTEPYPFKERHVEEWAGLAPTRLVDGQDLFWWGTRTPLALARLAEALDEPTP